MWSVEATTAPTALVTPLIKDRKSPAGVKCTKDGQNQNKKGREKMENFELSANKNSTKTLAGPDTEILQKFRSSPRGQASMKKDKLLPKSLNIRQVLGKLRQLRRPNTLMKDEAS